MLTLLRSAPGCEQETSALDHESKQTDDTHDFDHTLTTPHFDDEATLLSARPVVPFHELAKKDPKRRLYFGAGLVLTAIIGVVGGFFYGRMAEAPELRSETPVATTAVQEDLVSTTDAPGESPGESAEAPEESRETAIVPGSTTSPNVESAPKIPRPHRNPNRIVDKSASRPARTIWREPRRHRQTSDDLFRIQEIFEGSSRP